MDGVQDRPLAELLRGTRFEAFVAPLAQKKVVGAMDLLVRAGELGPVLGADAEALVLLAGRVFMPLMETPLSLAATPRLSWGCPQLDGVFGGGLQLAGVTELCGAAGSGKTQLALWLAGRSLAEHPESGVVYVCTEGEFAARRFRQMRHEGLSATEACQRVVVERAASFEELWGVATTRLPLLVARTRARLVVVDSVGALRADYGAAETAQRAEQLWRLAQRLKWLADSYACGVVVVNQVRADMEAGRGPDAVAPALGLVWANCVNTRLMVAKTRRLAPDGSPVRELAVDLCPYLPNFAVDFVVTSEGIQGVNVE
jgi:DNA-repair protein XRCC3